MIKQLKDLDTKIKNAEKEVNKLVMERSKALEKLLDEKGKTFNQGGIWYQIRKNKNMFFIVSSKVKFGAWLKKGNKMKNEGLVEV